MDKTRSLWLDWFSKALGQPGLTDTLYPLFIAFN